MAREARVNANLYVRKGNLEYQSRPSSFIADVATARGPAPGCVAVTAAGVNVDLSELVQPALCRLMNIHASAIVEWGVHDGSLFHPVGEMLPGETYIIRLSRNLGEEEDVPGSGTTSSVNSLFVRSNVPCDVLVEAFEA